MCACQDSNQSNGLCLNQLQERISPQLCSGDVVLACFLCGESVQEIILHTLLLRVC